MIELLDQCMDLHLGHPLDAEVACLAIQCGLISRGYVLLYDVADR